MTRYVRTAYNNSLFLEIFTARRMRIGKRKYRKTIAERYHVTILNCEKISFLGNQSSISNRFNRNFKPNFPRPPHYERKYNWQKQQIPASLCATGIIFLFFDTHTGADLQCPVADARIYFHNDMTLKSRIKLGK